MKKVIVIVLSILLALSIAGNALLYVKYDNEKDQSAQNRASSATLEEQLKQKNAEYDDAVEQLAAMDQTVAEKNDALDKTAEKLAAAEQSLSDAQASLAEANTALEEKNAAITRLEEEARVANDAVEQLTKDKQELTDKLAARSDELTAAEQEKDAAVASVKAEYEAKLSENEALVRSAAELNASAKQQKALYDELKTSYDESRRLLEESNAKVAALEANLEAARETAETLTADVATLKTELAETEKQHETALSAVAAGAADTVKQLGGLSAGLTEAEAKLNEAVQSLETIADSIEKGLTETATPAELTDVEALRVELAKVDGAVSALKDNPALNQSYLNSLNLSLDLMKLYVNALANSENGDSASIETAVSDMDAALASAKDTINILIAYNASLVERRNGLEDQLAQSTSENQDAAQRLKEMETTLESTRVALEQALDAAEATGAEFSDLKAELATAGETLKSLDADIASLNQTLQDKNDELARANATIEENTAALTAAQTTLKETETALAAAQKTLKETEDALAKANENLSAAETKLNEQAARLTESENETAQTKAQLLKSEEEVASLEQQLTDSEADATEARQQLETTKQQLDETRTRLSEAAETLAATTEKMEKTQASLDAIFAKRGLSEDGSVFSGINTIEFDESGLNGHLEIHNETKYRLDVQLLDEDGNVVAEATLHKGMRMETLTASSPVEPGRAYRLVYTYTTYKGELLYRVQTLADVTRP